MNRASLNLWAFFPNVGRVKRWAGLKPLDHVANRLRRLLLEEVSGHAIQNGFDGAALPKCKNGSSASLSLNRCNAKIFLGGKKERLRALKGVQEARCAAVRQEARCLGVAILVRSLSCGPSPITTRRRSGIVVKASTIMLIFL